MKEEEKELSKFLSLVLRHDPGSVELELEPAGWVCVDKLIEASAKHGKIFSIEQLKAVVENNDKKRFAFSADGKMIRANQGHSIEVELGYEPAKPPAFLFHGTASRFLDSIKAQGLTKQERHHVHMTASEETARAVGSRYGKPRILKLSTAQMYLDGYQFFLSANDVWLTETVPPKYIDFPE